MPRCFAIAGFILALAWSAASAAPAPTMDRSWPVTGYGLTEADAQADAYSEAERTVNMHLDRQAPGLDWHPDAVYLRSIGAVRVEKVRQEEHAGRKDAFAVDARVELTEPILRKMQEEVDVAQRKALEPVVSERHGVVGRVLAAFVALFLVIAGYLRLEELTRGYYTTLLRMGAGAVVLLTVLGLFLVR